MNYFVALVIENGLTFYLSSAKPRYMKSDRQWFGYMGPQQANRFKTREEAAHAIVQFAQGKGKLLAGIAEVQYFTVKNDT